MIIGNGHARARGRIVLRVVTVAALVSAATLLGTLSAYAGISATSNANTLADALKASDTVVTGASWDTGTPPPSTVPNGVVDSVLDGFPTDGSTFAILTTGDPTIAEGSQSTPASNSLSGGNVRGDTDYDVSILKVDFTVGEGMNCMRFDFRFFSEEYPDFLNGEFNDAFIAELDSSTWTTSGSAITAPNNFAFDPNGQPISINAAGNTSMTGDPTGTVYGGATPVLTAAHEVTPGSHSLYLSIFDQGGTGDPFPAHLYDSAVFVDNLVVGHAANPDEQCQPGAAPKMFNLTLTPLTAENQVGTPHTVQATLEEISPAGPVENGKILFSTAGVHSASGADTTDSAGEATFTYTGTIEGTDIITACYDIDTNDTCDEGEPFASVTKTWVAAPGGGNGGGDDDGEGGLPITGRATGLIAGVGALVLALGLVGYVVIRRRRIRFIAE